MSAMAQMFGISEAYIVGVSTTIPKLLAYLNLSMFTMKRQYTTYGPASLGETIADKLKPFEILFPTGVTSKYVISFVNDFLSELCR